jgi:hypothetical protein
MACLFSPETPGRKIRVLQNSYKAIAQKGLKTRKGEAIKIGAKAVWMQESVINEESAAEAKKAGLKVVMNKCMRKEHMKLHSGG